MKMETGQKSGWIMQNPVVSYIKRNIGIIIAIIIISTILSILEPIFRTTANLTNVSRQIVTNLLLSYGMTMALLIGAIDLTVGSVVAAAGCIFITLIGAGIPFVLSLVISVLFGALTGACCAGILNATNLPPFIVTLAMQKIIRGVGYIVTNGKPVQLIDSRLKVLGSGYILGIPNPVWIAVLITIFLVIIVNKTKFGRHVYAVGGNEEASRFAGVNIHSVRFRAYMISGCCAAIAGIILSARMYSGQPELATGYESDAFAASVLGGVRFTGGNGTIGGVVLGALLLGIVNNGMNLLNIPSYVQTMVQGCIILGAITLDSLKRDKKER